MNVYQFFKVFTQKIDEMLEEEVFIGNDDPDILEDGTYTMLFNCAMYEIAWEHGLKLLPEKPTGRGGYTDISIYKGDNRLIEVEHENRPLRTNKKQIAIYKDLMNLVFCTDAMQKVLISYTFEDCSPKKLIWMCEKYLEDNKKFITKERSLNKPIYLFHAPADFSDAIKEFKMVKLKLPTFNSLIPNS